MRNGWRVFGNHNNHCGTSDIGRCASRRCLCTSWRNRNLGQDQVGLQEVRQENGVGEALAIVRGDRRVMRRS